MPVEFISLTNPNRSNDLVPLAGAPVEPEYLTRYARTLDDHEYNYTLVPYGSSSFDPWTIAATIISVTKKLKVIIAVRPNTLYPTLAAKALATLDQISSGRVVVHFIAGGDNAEQAREGDFLTKDQRYERLEEFIKICKRAWESTEPFDWEGKYYQFKNFRNLVVPTNGKSIPVSVGGSSDEAYRVGGSLGDIFGLWGEPLKETKEQIDRIYAEAEKAGRTDRPRIWVTFRPIVADTEELAWAKAHRTLDTLNANREKGKAQSVGTVGGAKPQNVGSQRLLEIASRGEVQDRALWYPTVTATGARGASTALVGSYQTIIDSILDYVDLGCDLISIRGYDNLNDAIDYGRYVLPGVRAALKERAENGSGVAKTVLEGVKNGVEELKNGVEAVKISADGVKSTEEVKGAEQVKGTEEVKGAEEVKSVDGVKSAEEVKSADEVEGAEEVKGAEQVKGAEEVKGVEEVKSTS